MACGKKACGFFAAIFGWQHPSHIPKLHAMFFHIAERFNKFMATSSECSEHNRVAIHRSPRARGIPTRCRPPPFSAPAPQGRRSPAPRVLVLQLLAAFGPECGLRWRRLAPAFPPFKLRYIRLYIRHPRTCTHRFRIRRRKPYAAWLPLRWQVRR